MGEEGEFLDTDKDFLDIFIDISQKIISEKIRYLIPLLLISVPSYQCLKKSSSYQYLNIEPLITDFFAYFSKNIPVGILTTKL